MSAKRKKKNRKKKQVHYSITDDSHFSLFEVVILILVSVIFGVIIGYSITYGNSNLSKVRSHTHLGEIVNTYNNIVDNYYDDVDEEKMSEYAIKGMLYSLEDPYSAFLDENTTNSFNESVDGEYVGIGITVFLNEQYNQILSIVEHSPAAKAGLQVGDFILSVDGYSCENLDSKKLYQMIEGPVGTPLKIDVLRDSVKLSFVLKRDIIEIQNVTSKVVSEKDAKIGYIKIDLFSSNSYDQFVDQLEQLEKKNIQSLIIDLRNNPGGHLVQARKILSLFFPKKKVLYQIEKNGKIHKIHSLNNDVREYPVVLLINEETASSAEVLASCFQDNYKNIHLVGVTTYGKGNVQKTISLLDGSSIKFTVESWLTSKGQSVNAIGIVPDIMEEQNPTYYVDYTDDADSQLQRAISLLK